MVKLKVTKGSDNVFEDLGFSPREASSLFLRSEMMITLVGWYNASGLTQIAAAEVLGVSEPRLNQLLKGKIEAFSLDVLVDMVTNAGMAVELSIKLRSTLGR